ncbi:hypothetical protein PIB30_100550 [Stylosanthes scabra]|uniref:Uncharacterized protein n=1 Tax=Stylosanthes scabra TaxID=79078 RepID=A0ABU6ZWA3_9FABA|nr:hypothetical protein [Stylosanthes scabra]
MPGRGTPKPHHPGHKPATPRRGTPCLGVEPDLQHTLHTPRARLGVCTTPNPEKKGHSESWLQLRRKVIPEQIALRGWRRLAAPRTDISKLLVQELYANAAVSDEEATAQE